MVLCQYYLNNSCRFGSKCANEHFDPKQLIKTEVEAAIKGTQWPLSCFGPFKEKPCLPNFINDQSFDEVRYLCYEAKKQNNFPAYAQQFAQEVMGAQNRMKALLTLSRDVIDAVVNLYNSQDPNASQSVQKANPFSMGGGGGGFGQAQTNNSNSLFGSTPQANPFANSGFAGAVQSTAGIFGGTQTSPISTAGVFAQQSTYAANGNAFGAPNASIFGGGQQQAQQQPTSAFSLPQVGGIQQQNNQAPNTFGAMTAQTNAFGAPQAGLFSSTTPQTGLFAQQNNQMSTNLFGQQAAQQQQPQNLGFGPTQPLQQQTPGLFGQQAVAPGQNLFGNTMQTQSAPQQPNAFGAPMQMQQPQQQPPQPIGYGGIQQQQKPTNMFGTMQQQSHQQMQQQHVMQQSSPMIGASGGFASVGGGQPNVFQQPNIQQPFGVQNNAGYGTMQGQHVSDTVYSRMEDLTPEALEAFKAPEFVLGKLPTVPPPRELC